MSRRSRYLALRPTAIVLGALLVCAAIAIAAAATAKAGEFKMVACASTSGAPPYTTETNTISAQHPSGIFDFGNYCGGAGGDPPGDAAFMRISEHEPSGNAGEGAYGRFVFETPWYVHFKAGGGYTREPNAFNDGWRARFWGMDFSNNGNLFLNQGAGLANSGVDWASSNIFGPHLWPFGGYLDFHHFYYELLCVRPAGCDRTNYNAVDANGFVFILNDDSPSEVSMAGDSAILQGQWMRGIHGVYWQSADKGSGMRDERVKVDGSPVHLVDNQARSLCNATSTQTNGEFSRTFQPCPTGGPWASEWDLDTSTLSDGAHSLSVCTQDYGQYMGLQGTGGETCDVRTIRVDNHPPGAPAGLEVTSANAARYLPEFGAHWQLPPDSGSPITNVHYNIVNAANEVVVAEKTVSGTNLSALSKIEGPSQAGDYRIRLWLEDEVGFQGSASTAPIPHDTTPPAAPQELNITPPTTSRAAQGFDVRWHNIVDQGSPVSQIHYQLLNAAGAVVVPMQTIEGDNVQAIQNLETPEQRGNYTLRMWLEDGEGNVGVPSSAPLGYECVRSKVSGGSAISSGLGEKGVAEEVVKQGEGSIIRGKLGGAAGGVGEAPICVFSRVVTEQKREFVGLAVTAEDGSYQFPIPAGASRDLSVAYRSGSREVSSHSTLQTIVHPTFKATKKVVYNKTYAKFTGHIPGPDNNEVVVVAQVKRGKGWLAYHRYRTRNEGEVKLVYKFNKTNVPTEYKMRLQVRNTASYPYEEGNSDVYPLIVLPKGARRH
jgi:hypothetical protein